MKTPERNRIMLATAAGACLLAAMLIPYLDPAFLNTPAGILPITAPYGIGIGLGWRAFYDASKFNRTRPIDFTTAAKNIQAAGIGLGTALIAASAQIAFGNSLAALSPTMSATLSDIALVAGVSLNLGTLYWPIIQTFPFLNPFDAAGNIPGLNAPPTPQEPN